MRIKNYTLFILCLLCISSVSAQVQEVFDYPLDTVNGEEVYRYEVERSVGLYRIGVNFNVPQQEIIRLNPQLRERGLHYGEILLIPTGRPIKKIDSMVEHKPVVQDRKPLEAAKEEVKPMPQERIPEPVVEVAEAGTMHPADTIDSLVNKGSRTIELALILPFESRQAKRSGNAERMMEFYQGALLALHGLQQDDVHYRLRVYDSERSEIRINALCEGDELAHVDGIVGLVYPIQIERMAEWSELHQVPILLPFCDDVNLSIHPQLLQFNSTDVQEADSLCEWIAARDSVTHCVAIETREADVTSAMRTLRERLQLRDIPYSHLALRDLMMDSAAYALDSTKENLILFHSDRSQHVRILLPHLAKLQEAGYRIRIVSQYSWQKEHIDLPQVYTTMFTRHEESEAYNALWSRYYLSEHVSDAPRYDLLGYDLMRAMVGWLHGAKELKGLQSDIRWVQVENGGYLNACVNIEN